MEVEGEQIPTTVDLTNIVVKELGAWTNDFIDTMNHFQRV